MESNFEKYETTQLYIDSAYRTNGIVSDFTQLIKPEIQKGLAYCVNSVSIPHSYLNMWPQSSSLTLAITFSTSGTITASIDNLNYDETTLKSAIETDINASLSLGTFEMYFRNGRVEFFTDTETMTITDVQINTTNSLYRYLGFITGDGIVGLQAARGSNFYNLSGPDSIYVHSRALSSNRNYSITGTQLEDNSAIHRVYVDVNSGSQINNNNQNVIWQKLPSSKLGKVDFSLRYNDGTLIDLQGLDWSMTISVLSRGNY